MKRTINPLIPIYGGIMMFGALIGGIFMIFIDGTISAQLQDIVSAYMLTRQTGNLSSIVISSGSINLILVFTLMFAGYCSVGLPIIALLSFFRGMSYGVMSSLIFCLYPETFFYITSTMLPFFLLSAIVIILSCKNATKQGLRSFKKGDDVHNTKKYPLSFLVNIGAVSVIATLEGLFLILVRNFFVI